MATSPDDMKLLARNGNSNGAFSQPASTCDLSSHLDVFKRRSAVCKPGQPWGCLPQTMQMGKMSSVNTFNGAACVRVCVLSVCVLC